MYPFEELSRLEAHKVTLHRRIAGRRDGCVGLTTQVLRPVVWLDRLRRLVWRFAPFVPVAMIPLSLLLQRRAAPRRHLPHAGQRRRLVGAVLRWTPLLLRAANRMAVSRRH